jgi:hypothetical protein
MLHLGWTLALTPSVKRALFPTLVKLSLYCSSSRHAHCSVIEMEFYHKNYHGFNCQALIRLMYTMIAFHFLAQMLSHLDLK